jgi:hypothetical protein
MAEFDGSGERALSIRPFFADARLILVQERCNALDVSEGGGDR